MNLAERVAAWAGQEPTVKGLVLIGSRIHSDETGLRRADPNSDWDFQVITSRPSMFLQQAWTISLGTAVRTYAVRNTVIGRVPKIAAIFDDGEADFVIIDARTLRLGRWLLSLGLHRRSARLRRSLQDLALIVRPGWRFLKDSSNWDGFYRRLISEVEDPRLSDADSKALADGFVCDYVWTIRKIERGELLAAQRMLHRSLAEANIRLLHEIKLRKHQMTFPEGRRAEFVLNESELSSLSVNAIPERGALLSAVDKSASSCRDLMQTLLGNAWRWPELPVR